MKNLLIPASLSLLGNSPMHKAITMRLQGGKSYNDVTVATEYIQNIATKVSSFDSSIQFVLRKRRTENGAFAGFTLN